MKEWAGEYKTLVVLGVEDEAELIKWEQDIKAVGGICEAFIEPDLGGQKTALAIHPSVDPKMFRNLSLYNPMQRPKLAAA